MAARLIDARNLQFVLHELLEVERLCDHQLFGDHGRDTFELVLAAAFKLGDELLAPSFREMDREPPRFRDGNVEVHPSVAPFLRACGDGGWIGAQASYEHGGQQLPGSVMSAFRGILAAANFSLSVYPALSAGAAHLITSFASPELVATYVPPMFAGRWQGTMALTEPSAGSSLGDLVTSATPTEHGYHLIKGQKIFISLGQHDAVDNVVHLLLARIVGAAAGSRGISLFVVPQRRPAQDGALEANDVSCTSIYHKLGYRGAPITQLSLGDEGDCRGWLVGEPHRGLRYMFQMMNEARVEVGMASAAIASAAYHAALDYARERRQGRAVSQRDPSSPQIPLIEHPDVRRMLLMQRAVVEGSLALVLQCALWSDELQVLQGEERERRSLLLDLLTPVAKSYPAEMAIQAVSQGLQCLGGYGYCDDFSLEQHYRDVRIHTLHEGTSGIQALDLLGRKVVAQGGKAVMVFLAELQEAIAAAQQLPPLADQAAALKLAKEQLESTLQPLSAMALGGEIDRFLADASLFLELFGLVAVGWLWLRQAVVAQHALDAAAGAATAGGSDLAFYRRKLATAQYFLAYELPKIDGLARRLVAADGLTLRPSEELFG